MGAGAILDRDVMENCSDNWHFSEELNDEMAGAMHRFGNLAEETACVKALGPEKAWRVWGAARRPVHLRDSSGGSVPHLRADRQAYKEARQEPQEEWGSARLSHVCSCWLLVLWPHSLHLSRAWPDRLSYFHAAYFHRNISFPHWQSCSTSHWMSI